ncbi:MAG: hypothetical protein ACKOF3_00135, partial [Spartobacteria bacterium]
PTEGFDDLFQRRERFGPQLAVFCEQASPSPRTFSIEIQNGKPASPLAELISKHCHHITA